MSEPLIRRRSLPDSLRYVAQKLNEPLSDAKHAATRTASKPDLLQALAEAGEEPELEYDHIDCVSGTVWWGSPLWTAKRHPGVQHPSAGPVRPDEEAPITPEEAARRYLYPSGVTRMACGSDNDGYPTCMGDGSMCAYSPELGTGVCTRLPPDEEPTT